MLIPRKTNNANFRGWKVNFLSGGGFLVESNKAKGLPDVFANLKKLYEKHYPFLLMEIKILI
jgi:hypothetical protein